MTYEQTVNYLYSQLPMFTKTGSAAYKKDLHNTIVLCKALDNPQNHYKTIHVGGTNGKGSTSHILAAILQQAGYKTGLYTSPHLKDFRERIRVNGKMVTKTFVKDFVKKHQEIFKQTAPSFFEVTVAMAFEYFRQEEVEVAVIEVGLGGRLDSTNIIRPDLSVITNISYDHTNILGSTLAEIAVEKAGIIKAGIPVIVGERHAETDHVFVEKAEAEAAPLFFAQDKYQVANVQRSPKYLTLDILQEGKLCYNHLELDLTGLYQLKNIYGAIAAVHQLRHLGYRLNEVDIRSALRQVKKLTGLQGRWQILQSSPLMICDTGHNKAGITEVLINIQYTKFSKLHIVFGMVKDKDITEILALLPKDAVYYFCQPGLERALPAHQLALQAAQHGLNGKVYERVGLAIQAAKTQAAKTDLIYVGGSTFVVAEAL